MESLPELRRSTTDRKVAGVCAMLAERWRVDPLLVRIAAVLLALSSGIGLVLYAAAWLAVPVAGSSRAPIDSLVPGARKLGRTTWVVILVAACIATAALVNGLAPFGVGPALVLAAVWYFGFHRPRQRSAAARPGPRTLGTAPFAQTTPFTEAAAAWQARVRDYLQDQGRPAAAEAVPTPPAAEPGYSVDAFLTHPDPVGLYAEPSAPDRPDLPAVAPPRRRTGRMHLIGWALTVAALVTVGVIDSAYQVPFVAYPAAALLALGITFVIGAWLPRPRGLVVVAVLLTLVTGFGAMAPTLPEAERLAVSYSSAAELPTQPVAQDFGSLEADLSQVVIESDATYTAEVDIGRLTVVVPPETNVRVDWQVHGGEADVLGLHRENGADLASTTISRGTDPDGPTLTINAEVGLGALEVRR